MLKIVQRCAKITKIATKTIDKLLEKPKISTPVKKLALAVSTPSAAFSIAVVRLSSRSASCQNDKEAEDYF